MGKAEPLAEDIDIEDDEPAGGEGSVVRGPGYSEIPPPLMPLDVLGEVGLRAYEHWCRKLIEVGALTEISRQYAENLGNAMKQIADQAAKGKNPSRGADELLKSATLKMEKFLGSKPIQGPGRGENVYTGFGFAKRARQRRHSHD